MLGDFGIDLVEVADEEDNAVVLMRIGVQTDGVSSPLPAFEEVTKTLVLILNFVKVLLLHLLLHVVELIIISEPLVRGDFAL